MLNVDKYRDELLEEMDNRREKVEGRCDDNCSGVEIYFRSIEDVKRRHGGGYSAFFSDDVKWLFSEYEPPLLENGDGLKPGDWIMVRNHESGLWNRRQFLCFYEHLFIAADDDYSPLVGGMFSSWKFARLPMEGE